MSDLPAWLRPLAVAVDGDDVPASRDVGRASAVLVLFSDGPAGPSVLLIERAADLRAHAGQVAFPGGAVDPTDTDPADTALREAAEEVGLDPASVRVFAILPPLFLSFSGYLVTPVLGWWSAPHPVGVVDPVEVAHVAVVPIATLADPANRFTAGHPSGRAGPGFAADGLFVWGFTAALLDRLLTLGDWARPWDDAVVRPVP